MEWHYIPATSGNNRLRHFTIHIYQFLLDFQSEEIQEEWKPSFLSSEEFTQLMLESIDGFILVLGVDGHILFTSESMASLLGYLPASLHNTTLYEIVADSDKIPLYNHLNMSTSAETGSENQVKLLFYGSETIKYWVPDLYLYENSKIS